MEADINFSLEDYDDIKQVRAKRSIDRLMLLSMNTSMRFLVCGIES
jgi:hypothetical protein